MSLPNDTVAMEFGECPTCTRSGHTHGDGQPLGINCGCGHHFHIGPGLLVGASVSCPRCEGVCPPVEVAGDTLDPAAGESHTGGTSEAQIIELVCAEVSAEVGDAIRLVAKTRKNPDPNFWANVMLRESWRNEHGSYDGWDEAARAGGVDPAIFGPAAA